jgi:hypothetical protein
VARTFGPTPEGTSKLLAYANTILGAIQAGGNVGDIWDAVQAGEAAGGPLTSGSTIFDMNYVAGLMRAINNAEIAVGNAPEGSSVTADMWAWAPWADQSTPAWGEPNYQIRYSYDIQFATGETQTLWGQTDWAGSIDGPLTAITDRALGSAQQAIGSYPGGINSAGIDLSGASVTGVGAIQILRV